MDVLSIFRGIPSPEAFRWDEPSLQYVIEPYVEIPRWPDCQHESESRGERGDCGGGGAAGLLPPEELAGGQKSSGDGPQEQQREASGTDPAMSNGAMIPCRCKSCCRQRARSRRRWVQGSELAQSASALRRIESLGNALLNYFAWTPTAHVLGTQLINHVTDFRAKVPHVDRESPDPALNGLWSEMHRHECYQLLSSLDSVASNVRRGMLSWLQASVVSASSPRDRQLLEGLSKGLLLPALVQGGSGSLQLSGSAGDSEAIPGAELQLLVLSAAAWEYQRSLTQSRATQAAVLHLLVHCMKPMMLQLAEWLHLGRLHHESLCSHGHGEFFVEEAETLPGKDETVEEWRKKFSLRARREPPAAQAQGHKVPSAPSLSSSSTSDATTADSPGDALPPGTVSESVDSAESASRGDTTPMPGGFPGPAPGAGEPGSSSEREWREAMRRAEGAGDERRAACLGFLEPWAREVLTAGLAVRLVRRLAQEKLQAGQESAAVHLLGSLEPRGEEEEGHGHGSDAGLGLLFESSSESRLWLASSFVRRLQPMLQEVVEDWGAEAGSVPHWPLSLWPQAPDAADGWSKTMTASRVGKCRLHLHPRHMEEAGMIDMVQRSRRSVASVLRPALDLPEEIPRQLACLLFPGEGSIKREASALGELTTAAAATETAGARKERGARQSQVSVGAVGLEVAEERRAVALAKLAPGGTGLCRVDRGMDALRTTRTGPMPFLPQIVQECLLPQIQRQVARAEAALVLGLKEHCNLPGTLRLLASMLLLQDGEVFSQFHSSLWQIFLQRKILGISGRDLQRMLHDARLHFVGQRNVAPDQQEQGAVTLSIHDWPPKATTPLPPHTSTTPPHLYTPTPDRFRTRPAYPGAQAASLSGDQHPTVITPSATAALSPPLQDARTPDLDTSSTPPATATPVQAAPSSLASSAPPSRASWLPPSASSSSSTPSSSAQHPSSRSTGPARVQAADPAAFLLLLQRMRMDFLPSSWPLQLVLDSSALTQYRECFVFLNSLRASWSAVENTVAEAFRKPRPPDRSTIPLLLGIRTKLASLCAYYADTVGFLQSELQGSLGSAQSLEQLVRAHQKSLQGLHRACFLHRDPCDKEKAVSMFLHNVASLGLRMAALGHKVLEKKRKAAVAAAAAERGKGGDGAATAALPGSADPILRRFEKELQSSDQELRKLVHKVGMRLETTRETVPWNIRLIRPLLV